MASGLRAKLNMMRSSAPVAATPRRGGVVCHVSREPLDPAILELPSTGLRRIGWCGPRFDIRRCLFLDTETTGLSGGAGTVAFLVGVGYVEGDAFVIEQLMLRELLIGVSMVVDENPDTILLIVGDGPDHQRSGKMGQTSETGKECDLYRSSSPGRRSFILSDFGCFCQCFHK